MILITLLFSVVRPHYSVVYAPKLKYADGKHAPPQIGRGVFDWFGPVTRTKESQLVEKVGLDGVVFLRFTRMCRNMFLALSLISIAILIPANTIGSKKSKGESEASGIFLAMTPHDIKPNSLWAHVISAYLINIIVAFFLWRNYVAITRLKKHYFESSDYLMSLHSRTLIITDIPTSSRTDSGIIRLLDGVEKTSTSPKASIGRNVKELPDLIEEHEKAVRKLEGILAKFLKNPDNLPSVRPRIKPSKNYRRNNGSEKVDAIDYLTERIRELEAEITHVRDSVDKRNPMPFGFARYEKIEDAHTVAFEARRKHPEGTTINLAPRPSDLIWKNLPLTKKARSAKQFTHNFWIFILTIVWIAPNALIAVFLSNLSNLALVWKAFDDDFMKHRNTWSIVQGVASPALTSLVYLVLPILFRRLSTGAGDLTKTSRERHVTTKLYAFFVFNNLVVFSIFSSLWAIIAAFLINRKNGQSFMDAVKNAHFTITMMYGLSNVSPFWLTWLLQRNLGAAIDLAQIISLTWVWFCRTFRNPTPRQAIEWTAPPPFEYAVYFNYFLFYTTVALSFVTLQPLVLPITAFYFAFDYWLKKYLLLYVFITKNESGGQFWRTIFNRVIFAIILSNLVIALVVKGAGGTWTMVFCIAPPLILMCVFKWYCSQKFDNENIYLTKTSLKDPESVADSGTSTHRSDKAATRFGHPALYQSLMTPMVHAKARHALSKIYRGRLDLDGASSAGYSDIAMDPMSRSQPGKTTRFAPAPQKDLFEVVPESKLDFAYYKDRSEFGDEHGGHGEMFGRPTDVISERSGTSRGHVSHGVGSNGSSRASSLGPEFGASGGNQRTDSPYRDQGDQKGTNSRGKSLRGGMYHTRSESESALLSSVQPVGVAPINQSDDVDREHNDLERWRTGVSGYAGGPRAEMSSESLEYDSHHDRG